MNMNPLNKASMVYPDLLAAIGRFIAKKGLANVCVMEFESGMIVIGTVLYETGETMNRRTETHVLSKDDLVRLMKGG
jgi:hypothetical protein